MSHTVMTDEPLLDMKAVAVRLGVSEWTVKRMVERREIPVLVIGRRTRRFLWSRVVAALGERGEA